MNSHVSTQRLRRELRRAGYLVSDTNGGHLRVEHPQMAGPYFTSATPSDFRAERKMWADLKRRTKSRTGP